MFSIDWEVNTRFIHYQKNPIKLTLHLFNLFIFLTSYHNRNEIIQSKSIQIKILNIDAKDYKYWNN